MLIEKIKQEKTHKLSFLIKENIKLLDTLLKNLIDSSDKQLLVISDNKLVYSNQRTTKSLGFTQKELKDKQLDEIFASNQPVQIKNYMSMAVSLRKKAQEPILLKVVSKNGIEKWFSPEFRRCFWKGKSSVLMVLHDVSTKSSKTEKTVLDESLIHLALQTSQKRIWDYNFKTGVSFISKEFFEILGYRPYEITTTYIRWLELLHLDSSVRFKKMMDL